MSVLTIPIPLRKKSGLSNIGPLTMNELSKANSAQFGAVVLLTFFGNEREY